MNNPNNRSKMNDTGLRKIFTDGAWRQNAGLVVLLGLSPLLAVTDTVVKGLALGLATMLTVMLSNLFVSLLRGVLKAGIRIPAFVLIIASVVTVIQLLMQAFFYDLYLALGIFIPLIVANCVILERAEVFASKNGPLPSVLDGFATGLGFGITLVLLGALRELTGRGTLLFGSDMLLGDRAGNLTLTIVPGHPGFLLAILPPGAFIGLALLIAARNAWEAKAGNKSIEQVQNVHEI